MIIAICDDQRRMLDKVYCYCKKIVQKKTEVFSYTRPEDLMQSIYRGIIPDLLILDIEMPEVSGLEFQKQLQRNKMDIDIIYLTSHSEMMQEAFGRNVVAFLNKDNYEIRLAEILTKYEQELSKVLEIQCEGKTKELELKYVLYIQASNKYSEVYYRQPGDIKTDYLLSGYTLSRWQEILPENQFCRVARNVILNYGNVKKIDRDMVYMTDDKCFKIPKGKVRQFRTAYHVYMRKQVVIL